MRPAARLTAWMMSTATICAGVPTALAQLPTPQDLGPLSMDGTPTASLNALFLGFDGGAADVFVVDGEGCGSDAEDPVFGTFLGEEVLFRFSLEETSRVEVLPPAGFDDIIDVSQLGASFFVLTGTVDDTGIAMTADGEFPAACAGEERLNRAGTFPNPLPPGEYLLAVDLYTGPPGDALAGFASGNVQFRLAARPLGGDPEICGASQGEFAADETLAIDVSNGPDGVDISGNQGDFSDASRICAYRQGGGQFAGVVSSGPELIYRFELAGDASVSLENNTGDVTPSLNPDFYLVKAGATGSLAAQTGVDVFADGTLLATVGQGAVSFLEDAGTFGVVEAGTYFLVVDSLSGNGPLNFDMELIADPIANCGVGGGGVTTIDDTTNPIVSVDDPFNVAFDDPDATVDNTLGGNRICAYRGSQGIPLNAFGVIESEPEHITLFTTRDEPPRLTVTLDEIDVGDEAGDPDLDFYIVEAPGGTIASTAVAGYPGFQDVTFATDALAFAPFAGPFGFEARGIAEAVLDGGTQYALVVEGLKADEDQSFDVTLNFEESFTPTASFELSDVSPENDLGQVALEGEFLTISLCGSIMPGDTEIAVWRVDASEGNPLVEQDDDGCGDQFGASFIEFPAEGENALPAGEYVIAVASSNAFFSDDFIADVLGSDSAVSGELSIGPAMGDQIATGFSATENDRDLFRFSIGSLGCNPADIAEPFGILDGADVNAFISAFGTGGSGADLAAPFGVLDGADVNAFISGFGAGCP